MVELIRKISKGSRFNQIYLQKNQGFGFEPGKTVLITQLTDLIKEKINIFEYNISLNQLKKEIIKQIFQTISSYGSFENIIVTGSFLEEGFNFEDIDIIILDSKNFDKKQLEKELYETISIKPHIVMINLKNFQEGITKDPLFRLMIDKYVSLKRTIFKKEVKINYKLIDAYLMRTKNLIDGFNFLNLKQRKKIIRDFVSLKLFCDGIDITLENIDKEINRIFGKLAIERLFFYGDSSLKHEFIKKFKNEFNKLEKMVIENASKQE